MFCIISSGIMADIQIKKNLGNFSMFFGQTSCSLVYCAIPDQFCKVHNNPFITFCVKFPRNKDTQTPKNLMEVKKWKCRSTIVTIYFETQHVAEVTSEHESEWVNGVNEKVKNILTKLLNNFIGIEDDWYSSDVNHNCTGIIQGSPNV